MVHVSEVLGLPVFDAAGVRVGRVEDLQVDSLRSRVEWILVRDGSKRTRVPWGFVASLSPLTRRVTLASGAPFAASDANGDLMQLRRDLLDKQIIDIQGRRVVKVN